MPDPTAPVARHAHPPTTAYRPALAARGQPPAGAPRQAARRPAAVPVPPPRRPARAARHAVGPPALAPRPNVRRLQALGTGLDVELDRLTLFEAAVAGLLDGAEVDEAVAALLLLDEPVALVGVKPLDGSGRHFGDPPSRIGLARETAEPCGRAVQSEVPPGGSYQSTTAMSLPVFAVEARPLGGVL